MCSSDLGAHPGTTLDQWVFSLDESTHANWSTQFALDTVVASDPGGTGVAVDALGNVYLAGTTKHAILAAQEPMAAGRNGYLLKFDRMGARQWAHYFCGAPVDDAPAVSVDVFGVAVTGSTHDCPDAPEASGGLVDAFVVSYAP